MEYLWYGLAGICGGLLGGMGMGGGTLLIPLLNIFYKVSQHTAQAINLVSFLPMAVIALIIHIKNGLLKFREILYIILSGAITCVVGCFIAKAIDGRLLGKMFGGFLLILAVFQFITVFKKKDK